MTNSRAVAPMTELWDRLTAPFDAAEVIEALAGPTHGAARHLVGALIATSGEAGRLLATMPMAIRSLAISTTVRAERCVGQVRGPILWSETAAAQASAAGDMGILVCALPEKAYDTPQNQVLVAALTAVVRAARAVDGGVPGVVPEEILHAARANGSRAAHYLDHRALSGVTARTPSGRDLHRTRVGNRRRTYQEAVAMLARAVEPLDAVSAPRVVEALVTPRSAAEHRVVAGLLRRAEARGHRPISLRVSHGAVEGGPLVYRNHGHASADGAPAGIFVGDVRVTSDGVRPADGGAGTASGPVVTVHDEADLDRALTLAGL